MRPAISYETISSKQFRPQAREDRREAARKKAEQDVRAISDMARMRAELSTQQVRKLILTVCLCAPLHSHKQQHHNSLHWSNTLTQRNITRPMVHPAYIPHTHTLSSESTCILRCEAYQIWLCMVYD